MWWLFKIVLVEDMVVIDNVVVVEACWLFNIVVVL